MINRTRAPGLPDSGLDGPPRRGRAARLRPHSPVRGTSACGRSL